MLHVESFIVYTGCGIRILHLFWELHRAHFKLLLTFYFNRVNACMCTSAARQTLTKRENWQYFETSSITISKTIRKIGIAIKILNNSLHVKFKISSSVMMA